jgi:hypothetical protein
LDCDPIERLVGSRLAVDREWPPGIAGTFGTPSASPQGSFADMSERPNDIRLWSDRRRRATTPWDVLRQPGRRVRPRRDLERDRDYFVDRIDARTFFLAILLLVLTLTDGAITLLLLEVGCEEINPAMSYLLSRGPLYFLLGKYALTTAGLPFLLIFRHFTLFRTRFRVGHLLPVFVAMYFVLLGYQVALMQAAPAYSHQLAQD